MLDSETICSIFEAPDCVYTPQLFESSQPDTELIGLDCWKLVHQMVNTSKRAKRNTFQLKEQLHVNKRGKWLLKLWKDMECCRTPWSSYRWWKTWVLLCAALNGVVVKEVQRFLCVHVWVSARAHVRRSLEGEGHDSELITSSWETQEMWEIKSRQETVSKKGMSFLFFFPLFVCYFELSRIHGRI